MAKSEISFVEVGEEDVKGERITCEMSNDQIPDITARKRRNDIDDGNAIEINENRTKVTRFENDYELKWTKLRLIVEELIWNKDTYKKWNMELHDVLFIISSDPDNLTFFEMNYGTEKVEIAINEASKLIRPNGKIDQGLSDFFWQKRHEFANTLNVSYATKRLLICNSAAITDVVESLHKDYTFNRRKHFRFSFKSQVEKLELYVMMAVDPINLLKKAISFEIGLSKVRMGIAYCTHILERVVKQHPNSESELFKSKRNNRIKNYANFYLKKTFPNYNEIFKQVRKTVTECWTEESDLQIDAVTILLMMDPKMMNSKFLLFTQATTLSKDSMTDIENELKLCSCQPMHVDAKLEVEKVAEHNILDLNKRVIVANVNVFDGNPKHLRIFLSKKTVDPTRAVDPNILVYEIYFQLLVCSDLTTLEWLKKTANESSSNVSIGMGKELEDDEFRNVFLLSQVRITEPFDTYRADIKKYYPDLRTELWTYLETVNDWQMSMRVDIRSILYFE